VGKKSREKKERRRIRGHSHVPAPMKGVYQVGSAVSPTGRLNYNQGPVAWQSLPFVSNAVIQAAHADAQMREFELLKEFYGDSMCGDCIATKVTGGHDPRAHNRRRCQLCGTLWPGLEPENNRRGAILAQRTRTSEEKSPPRK
jgi:hypothetical protein